MTSEKDPKSMENLLEDYGDSDLRKLIRQAKRLQIADQLIKQYLPENLKPHCHVGAITPVHITLFVDSAAWLTHLRYNKPQLIQQLRQQPQFAYLQAIDLKVQPKPHEPKKIQQKHSVFPLSTENKQALLCTAELVTHPLLKKSLEKLAN